MSQPSDPSGPSPDDSRSQARPPEAAAPSEPPPPPPPPGPMQQPGQQAAAYPSYQSAPPTAPGYGYGQGGPLVPPGTHYDPASELAIPDGTTLASHGRRIGAYFLAIPLGIVTLFIGYVIWGLIVWGRGQTPALQVLGMRCWKPDEARRPGWGDMALREVVGRFIIEGIVPFAGLVSFIMFLAGKQRRAIHDYIGGTVVLHDPNKVLAEPVS
jgi:uncharacterized RDD family membrane protein YckC